MRTYKWIMRKYWKSWAVQDFKRWWYKVRYGYRVGIMNPLFIPYTGETKYCSVKLKGKIIEIKHKHDPDSILITPKYDEVRIIPYVENHGVMVELFKDGKMYSRNLLNIQQLSKDIIYASNVDALADRTYSEDQELRVEMDKIEESVYEYKDFIEPDYDKILAEKIDYYGETKAAYEFAAHEYAREMLELNANKE